MRCRGGCSAPAAPVRSQWPSALRSPLLRRAPSGLGVAAVRHTSAHAARRSPAAMQRVSWDRSGWRRGGCGCGASPSGTSRSVASVPIACEAFAVPQRSISFRVHRCVRLPVVYPHPCAKRSQRNKKKKKFERRGDPDQSSAAPVRADRCVLRASARLQLGGASSCCCDRMVQLLAQWQWRCDAHSASAPCRLCASDSSCPLRSASAVHP